VTLIISATIGVHWLPVRSAEAARPAGEMEVVVVMDQFSTLPPQESQDQLVLVLLAADNSWTLLEGETAQ